MAMLKDSLIAGDLRVTGTIYGDVPLNDLVDADDLKAIEALTGTSGWLKKTATNTWALGTFSTSDIPNIDASKITSGTLPIARGGTGLTASPSMLTNLGSTTAANVLQASPRPGVTGTLGAANGGTGETTLKDAANALINALETGSSALTANDYIITQYASGGTTHTTYHRRPASAVRVGGLTTARKLTIGSTGKTFDGTGNVSWTLAEIGAAAANHNHDSSYVNVSGDTMTGALTLSGDPTSAKHATTKQYVDQSFAANDAMIFKGTIGSSGATVTALPNTHNIGWTYKVLTAGTYAGVKCEIGDLIICITDGTSANNAHWTVAQTNLDGAVIGPASATDKQIAIFNGTSGKSIKGGSIGSHSYTPAGTITLTNGNTTTTVSAASSGTTTYTPGGTVSQPTFTGSSLTSTGNFTPAGSVSVSTNATTNKTATVSAASSGTTTYTPGGTNSAPAFTGTAATIVVSGGTGTATYTPAGTIAVSGTTSSATVVKTATFNTVVTQATVTNEVLTITTGASGSSTNQTGVRIADPAYTFTGTGTRLTASYTPAGSVAAPTFTGTAVRLVTGKIAVPSTYTATFTGTQGSVSVSGTPAGTVSKPTFSGTAVRLVTGNISRPTSATFSGTAATLSHSIS